MIDGHDVESTFKKTFRQTCTVDMEISKVIYYNEKTIWDGFKENPNSKASSVFRKNVPQTSSLVYKKISQN